MPANEGSSLINDKDVRKLARTLEKAGFTFRGKPGQHLRVFAPDGTYACPLSSSPGTPRYEVATLRSLARKWGVQT